MAIDISIPDVGPNLHPQITVLGVGGSGGNAVNNMMNSNLEGVEFLVANTDAQALQFSKCKNKIQLGIKSTKGLGAGMRPDIGKQAAEEAINQISEKLEGSHMVFIAAGMGGGTGTGAAPVIAKLAREKGILTVGVVTKPFHFEGTQRMKLADEGIDELQQYVDTLLTIPNQNLFRIANERTTFADAFKMADDVLYAGVRGVTDLMVQPGLINLDFSDVKNVMSEMGKAMMGTGQSSGEGRAVKAAEAAMANPLIDDVSLKGAKGVIINITGGTDITLYEVDEAANKIKQEVDENANIIYGTTCDERLEDVVRVSIVATGIDANHITQSKQFEKPSMLSIDNSVYINTKHEEEMNVSTTNSNFDNEATHEEEKVTENSEEDNSFMISNSENHISNLETQDNETAVDEENVDEAKIHHSDDNISVENSIDKSENLSDNNTSPDETSVRRLSLFDTLDDGIQKNNDNKSLEDNKSEPVLEDDGLTIEKNEELSEKIDISNDHKIDFEEADDTEEYNQDKENEEELLDIPTFLRRQAN